MLSIYLKKIIWVVTLITIVPILLYYSIIYKDFSIFMIFLSILILKILNLVNLKVKLCNYIFWILGLFVAAPLLIYKGLIKNNKILLIIGICIALVKSMNMLGYDYIT